MTHFSMPCICCEHIASIENPPIHFLFLFLCEKFVLFIPACNTQFVVGSMINVSIMSFHVLNHSGQSILKRKARIVCVDTWMLYPVYSCMAVKTPLIAFLVCFIILPLLEDGFFWGGEGGGGGWHNL